MHPSDLIDKLADFREQGFVVFESVVDESVMASCRALLREFTRTNPDKWTLGGLIELDPALAMTLAADPRILRFAEEVMGPFVQLDGLTLVSLRPATTDRAARVAGWHRDPWAQVPRSTAFERPLGMNALCYLQNLTNDTGPLRVIRGSHRYPLTIPPEDCRRPHRAEEPVYAKAGDYVLVHNNLVHTGTPPGNVGANRDFVSIFYNLTWLRPTIQCEGPRAKELIAHYRSRKDHQMLRLLGVDEHLRERADCGFLTRDEEMWARWAEADRLARP